MQNNEEREVCSPAQDECSAVTQETAGRERDAAAAHALAHPAAGGLAEKRAAGALSLLCRASQWEPAHSIPRRHHAFLVADAAPPHSAPPDDMAAHVRPRRALAAQTPYPSSVSRATPARHDPRQEPGAVVPHAGICAGGAGSPASLPRPSQTYLTPSAKT